MIAPYLIVYLSIAVFAGAVLIRALRIKSMPVHLRWELYPVAHERGRARYGGSYFEEVDWWTKPRGKSRLAELSAMLAEILVLKGVWEHNRSMWWRSYPFHLGLYILMGFVVIWLVGAVLQVVTAGAAPGAAGLGSLIDLLLAGLGIIGMGLTALGSLLLLNKRLTDDDLKQYTTPGHIINLLFILVTMLVGLIAFAVDRGAVADARAFACQLITFKMQPVAGGLVSVAIVLGALLIAYIPLTHMAHFFIKYFTWHKVRWDDRPNMPGGELEARIQEVLNQPVTWAAPHIKADGKKTWVDVATEKPE